LNIWADDWHSSQRVADGRALGRAAAGQAQKLAYASFLNRVGDPVGAAALVGSAATLPISATNAEANAVLADTLALSGKTVEAKRLFDAILAYDSGNATALRGRAQLLLAARRAKEAVPDAQKLVSVLPTSPYDRILLARCYSDAGDNAEAERTLWNGFHEIPASEPLFAALKESKQGNPDALASLSEEFTLQRNASLFRGIL
jgi:predicted Zn-dependent protease